MYQTAFGRHGDRTRTAESGVRTNHARYHCAVRLANNLLEASTLVGFPEHFSQLTKVVDFLNISSIKQNDNNNMGSCITLASRLEKLQRLASLSILGDQLTAPLKPLNTIVLWWFNRFQWPSIGPPWCGDASDVGCFFQSGIMKCLYFWSADKYISVSCFIKLRAIHTARLQTKEKLCLIHYDLIYLNVLVANWRKIGINT